MGLLDQIGGQVLNALAKPGGNNAPGGLMEVVLALATNPQTGGLPGLIATFQQKGLGGVVASWVSTGGNLPISPEQLQSVLGSEQVAAIARQLGLDPGQASGQLAELLPKVVDQLTPGGTVPQADQLGQLLGLLRK